MSNVAMENAELLKEQERLSWLLAGVSTAVLGYLNPHETYAGMPIDQIEEAIRLRVSFEMACDALAHFFSISAGKALSANDLMCEFMRKAEKRIEEIRNFTIPEGRARF